MGDCAVRGGFAERLMSAGQAKGIFTPSHLASVCDWPQWRLMEIIANPGKATWEEGMTLCDVLNVRSAWLLRGEGIPQRFTYNSLAGEVLTVLDAMPAELASQWISIGLRMAGLMSRRRR